jgi:hypothetical protein
MTSLDDLWVLEWSETQKCYHKDKLCNSVVKNINSFHCRRPNDYVPIYVGSDEEVSKASERFHAHTGN